MQSSPFFAGKGEPPVACIHGAQQGQVFFFLSVSPSFVKITLTIRGVDSVDPMLGLKIGPRRARSGAPAIFFAAPFWAPVGFFFFFSFFFFFFFFFFPIRQGIARNRIWKAARLTALRRGQITTRLYLAASNLKFRGLFLFFFACPFGSRRD